MVCIVHRRPYYFAYLFLTAATAVIVTAVTATAVIAAAREKNYNKKDKNDSTPAIVSSEA